MDSACSVSANRIPISQPTLLAQLSNMKSTSINLFRLAPLWDVKAEEFPAFEIAKKDYARGSNVEAELGAEPVQLDPDQNRCYAVTLANPIPCLLRGRNLEQEQTLTLGDR